MGKSKATKQKKFSIHVDQSCLTDSTDLAMSPNRETSDSTTIRHDSWKEGQTEGVRENLEVREGDAQTSDDDDNEGSVGRERKLGHLQAKIHAAARAVIADIEKDQNYRGNEDSILSVQTDESHESGDIGHTYEGTDYSRSYDSGNEELLELTRDMSTFPNAPEHDEELMESIERDEDDHNEGRLKVGRNTKARSGSPSSKSEFDNDPAGDSSSHNGDIDDDVFSRNSGNSARSSLISQNLDSSDEPYGHKALTSPTVGEEASTRRGSEVSHLESYMHDIPDAVSPSQSKVLARPPFRTPSAVRAMQMSSPTPSVYTSNTSPRSVKRHPPTVSRLGTPISHTPRHRTPTRLKAKKEQPLVLLHVTVLPLVWQYSHFMSSSDLPDVLKDVKENWRLLQEKLVDTVLERGILIPHPQDSYEVLEERLLEALELPVRPRALILKCGHYMGPLELEAPSSDEDADDSWADKPPQIRKWCDICRRDVKLENGGEPVKRKFRVKIFASNGLMHAGAWAAAWREMERVDVEIGPWIESAQLDELERMALSKPKRPVAKVEDLDDGFEDEEEDHEVVRRSVEPSAVKKPPPTEMPSSEHISEDMSKDIPKEGLKDASKNIPEIVLEGSDPILKKGSEDIEDVSDVLGDSPEKISKDIPKHTPEEMSEDIPDNIFGRNSQDIPHSDHTERHDRAPSVDFHEPEPHRELGKTVADYEREMQELLFEEEQMRKRHAQSPEPPTQQRPQSPEMPQPSFDPERPFTPQPSFNVNTKPRVNEDSLSELLVAAGKVALKDRKNLAIVFLSLLVLILALRPTASPSKDLQMGDSSAVVPEILHASDGQSNPSTPLLVKVTHGAPGTSPKSSGPQVQANGKKVQQRKSKVSKESPKKGAVTEPPPNSDEEVKSEEGMLEGENESMQPGSAGTMPGLSNKEEEDIQEEKVEAIESQSDDTMPQAEVKKGAEEIGDDSSENELNAEVGAMDEEQVRLYDDEDGAEQADDEADLSAKEALKVPESSDSAVVHGDDDEYPASEKEEL